MKCILNDGVKIRGFQLIPFCYYQNDVETASKLTLEEYNLLKKCDGKQEIEPSDLLYSLMLDKKIIRPLKKEEQLSNKDYQLSKYCDNRYMPRMNLQITGHCNYNCIHCFNAIDNAPLNTHYKFEDLEKLFAEAEECGIHAITITGGEPLVHPDFIKIIKSIYAHHMYVFELNTNGALIKKELLDELKNIGCKPLIKISFDGLKYHDWMRNHKGAEEVTINAIKLCIEEGFRVKIQYNINKNNLSTVKESMELLDALGVEETRFIPTTPSPRWDKNQGNNTFSLSELIDASLDIVSIYASEKLNMCLDIWQIIQIDGNMVHFSIMPGVLDVYKESIPFCKGARGMIAIAANGNVYPCLQMSGTYDNLNYFIGNVKKTSLKTLLNDSPYMKHICQTLKDKREFNNECKECKYFFLCWGGCSAHGLLAYKNILGKSPLSCYFYKNKIYQKFKTALPKFYFVEPDPDLLIDSYKKAN